MTDNSQLMTIYLYYTREVFGKVLTLPTSAQTGFHKMEMILTKSDIDLHDYTLTVFTDRKWHAQKFGYVPWKIFVSITSAELYLKRLIQGVEIMAKPNDKPDFLTTELEIGQVIIALVLDNIEPTHDMIESLAACNPGWLNDTRRPIEEAQQLLAVMHRTPCGSYKQIANFIKERRHARLELHLSPKDHSPDIRKDLVA